jgi:hypothetical protein
MSKLIGDTYKERGLDQVNHWCNGESIHNEIDDECCPDFSCCNPDVNTPQELREAFRIATLNDHNEAIMYMLGLFLGNLIVHKTNQ